jgi:hypothetical protein
LFSFAGIAFSQSWICVFSIMNINSLYWPSVATFRLRVKPVVQYDEHTFI